MRTVSYERWRSRTHDFLELGSTPHDEPCTQAGDNAEAQKIECYALRGQLIRLHGEPPIGMEFCLVRNTHDFGTYYELGIIYPCDDGEDPETDEAADLIEKTGAYMNACESLPDKWDSDALVYLAENDHPLHKMGRIIQLKIA